MGTTACCSWETVEEEEEEEDDDDDEEEEEEEEVVEEEEELMDSSRSPCGLSFSLTTSRSSSIVLSCFWSISNSCSGHNRDTRVVLGNISILPMINSHTLISHTWGEPEQVPH